MLGHQRLIVRRTRLVGAQAELWRSGATTRCLTNRTALEVVDSEHRDHSVIELAIRDLKDQALAHFPSGRFLANSACSDRRAGAQPAEVDDADRTAGHRWLGAEFWA